MLISLVKMKERSKCTMIWYQTKSGMTMALLTD